MLRTMSIFLTASLLLPIWAAQASAQELPESEVEAWRGPMNEFSAYDIDLSGGLSREEFTRGRSAPGRPQLRRVRPGPG
ncbi:hypothetical protein [Desulfocurvibacter africanus]|uniref:EF-hand domain-containing protein n=1 Tax=Desulfocurvibacter africanus subsp. africanus str. Walvis Bay TaxID=690850 RepID=F3YUZ9_DESAF|nr:hypothetical protein [Desulfocurvibacter africanus]EGJ49249.1 hypothetical protein Desaf_0901 [Desulfocurvibacter africanus subsp. africanus str. Walvis Bay]